MMKIDDQDILVDIAKNSKSENIRVKTIKRITNPTIIVDIAKNDKNESVRAKTVKKITNPIIVMDIAKRTKITKFLPKYWRNSIF